MSVKSMKKTVKRAYDSLGLDTGFDSDHKVVYTRASIDENLTNIEQIACLSEDSIIFLTNLPYKAGKESFERCCVETAIYNARLILGSYDMDRDGTIRFRSTLTVDGADISCELVKRHILTGYHAVLMYRKEVWANISSGAPDSDEIPNEDQTYQPSEDQSVFNPMFR